MLEKEVEKYLVEQCSRRGYMCLKFTSPSTAGVPDRIILSRYGTYFAELKRPEGGRISPLQKATFDQFAKHGQMVYIIRSKEDVIRLVNEISEMDESVMDHLNRCEVKSVA